MRQLSFAVLIGATWLLFSSVTINNAIDWQIANGYSINFSCKGAEGIFKKFNGVISFDEVNLSKSKFSIEIEVSSISTGNGLKNMLAKSSSWFDAKKFPKITFVSNKFLKTATGYQVEGILEMHGIQKQIAIPFSFSSNVFKGNFSVNRIDYGVGTLLGMSKNVSNEIKLEIIVPTSKK